MQVIPAIDLIDGSCVRLTEGKYELKKKYSDDPVAVAKKWQEAGAAWLHVIDLDGARTGQLRNLDVAVDIKDKTGLKVQYGGGIRAIGKLKAVIKSGIDRAIIGTGAIEDRDFFKTAVETAGTGCILSVDFDSDGIIYKQGWKKSTDLDVFRLLPELEKMNVGLIIITNISRDGTLGGIDMGLIEKVLDMTSIRLIVAGGISGEKDIIKLKGLEKRGVSGIIIGKALYEGRIELRRAIEMVQG